MAAFGIEALLTGKALARRFVMVALLIGAGMLILMGAFDIFKVLDLPKLWGDLVVLSVLVLAILFVIGLMRFLKPAARKYGIWLLLGLMLLEPMVMHREIVRPLRYDPYTIPPFLSEYLRRDAELQRIFGLDYILFPETATPYRLDDLRFEVAASSQRRFLFNAQFLSPNKVVVSQLMKPGEFVSPALVQAMVDSFAKWDGAVVGEKVSPYIHELSSYVSSLTGLETPFYYSKFFDLLNTRYVVTLKGNPPLDSIRLLRLIDLPGSSSELGVKALKLKDDERNALYLRSPAHLDIPVLVPAGHPHLQFGTALDPASCGQSIQGNSLDYRVLLTDDKGQHEIFRRSIDPKSTPAECGWSDQSVDLSAWSGQRVTLTLTNESAASGEAYWSEPLVIIPAEPNPWQNGSPSANHFELVYDKEVQIYRNNYAYPRAFVVYHLQQATEVSEALRQMVRPDFDPATQAVVEGNLPQGWDKTLLANGPPTPPSVVQFKGQTTNAMQMQTTLEKPGLLVISNSYNKGLKAYVDGVATLVLPVDSFLCGIYLGAGSHQIKFAYEPDSFTVGVLISLGALVVLLVAAIIELRWKLPQGKSPA